MPNKVKAQINYYTGSTLM